MNALAPIAFNLLVNAIGSFVLALGLVYAALWLFRIGPGTGRLSLLLLPWLKVVWDLSHGIPTNSFFWLKLHGAVQNLGSLRIGFGVSGTGPCIQAVLGGRLGSTWHPQSAAELLSTLLSRKLSPAAPHAIACGWVGIALLLLLARAVAAVRFALRMRRVRAAASLVEVRRSGARAVCVYVSGEHCAVPFAAGVLEPYVMFSRSVYDALTPAAREAALQHELAHVAHHDAALIALLHVLSDLLWFLPGLRQLLARTREEMELRADARAIARGAAPEALAHALVSVGEMLHAHGAHAGLGLLRRRRLLAQRVERLVGAGTADPAPRFGYGGRVGRVLILACTVALVLSSLLLGNHA